VRGGHRLAAGAGPLRGSRVWTALLRKELAELLPFTVLGVLIWLLSPGWDVFFDFPDDDSIMRSQGFFDASEVPYWVLLHILMTLSATAGLLAREDDNGTIAFLDALPVRRIQVLGAKVVVALGVLMAGPLAATVLIFGEHVLARTSLAPELRLELALLPLLVHASFVLGWLGLGLLLSFLRRFGWLLAGLMLVALPKLAERWPAFEPMLPLQLLDLDFRGAELLMPWVGMAAWAGLGLLGIAATAVFWGRSAGVLRRLGTVRSSLLWRAGLGILGVLSLGVWFYAFAVLIGDEPDPGTDEPGGRHDSVPGASFNRWGSAVLVTDRFVITTDADRLEAAAALAGQADQVHDQVAAWLGAEPFEQRLKVDGLALSRSHGRVGRQMSEGLEIDIGGLEPDEARAVLAHEVSHALSDRHSNGVLNDQFSWTRWFNEGLAQWIELRAKGEPVDESRIVQAAACSDRLLEVPFETLIVNSRLSAERDQELVYGLGALWVDTLVQEHGDAAPGEILAAIGRDDRPDGLEARTLWEDALYDRGYDLEAQLERWEQRLGALEDQCPALPPLTPALEQDGRALIATLEPTDNPILRLCWMRTTRSAPPEQWRVAVVKEDRCTWKRVPVGAPEVQVLVGAMVRGQRVSGRWQTATLE